MCLKAPRVILIGLMQATCQADGHDYLVDCHLSAVFTYEEQRERTRP